MWLSKPVYESLPYYYVALGVLAGLGSFYVERWHWSTLLAAVAVPSLVGGLVLMLRRHGYRRSRSRLDVRDQA